jgi:hypothetical protein
VVTYAGYIGALTGQRPNVFTVTVDERGKYKVNLVALRLISTFITGLNPDP